MAIKAYRGDKDLRWRCERNGGGGPVCVRKVNVWRFCTIAPPGGCTERVTFMPTMAIHSKYGWKRGLEQGVVKGISLENEWKHKCLCARQEKRSNDSPKDTAKAQPKYWHLPLQMNWLMMYRQVTPAKAETVFPPITFQGCAMGAFGAAYSKVLVAVRTKARVWKWGVTEDAPKPATKNSMSSLSKTKKWSMAPIKIPKKDPNQEKKTSWQFSAGIRCCPSIPLHFTG